MKMLINICKEIRFPNKRICFGSWQTPHTWIERHNDMHQYLIYTLDRQPQCCANHSSGTHSKPETSHDERKAHRIMRQVIMRGDGRLSQGLLLNGIALMTIWW